MHVTGDLIWLRPIETDDLPRMLQWDNDPQVFDWPPQTIEQATRWLKQSNGDRCRKVFAIILGQEIIGHTELSQIAWRSRSAELRIRIGEPHLWGKGYGTDAVQTMIKYAFSTLHLNQVYLRVFENNKRAVGCYAKAGFQKTGRLCTSRQYGTNRVLLMQRLREDASTAAAVG